MARRWQWTDQYAHGRRQSGRVGIVDVALFLAASGTVAYVLNLLGLQ
ncbi:MAG: hypothetical protein U1E46_18330 [Hyphomicrobiales bacterium]